MNFNEKCYELLKKVPKRKVVTYKIIAAKLGTKAYRAVGNAMHHNKYPDKIPCFKVINSNGTIGGYKGHKTKHLKEKIRKLKAEGIIIKNNKINLNKYLHRF